MSRLPFDAVCTAELAALRAEPADDAEQVTQVLRGEPLQIDERGLDGWLRVRTAYGYPGWLRADSLAGDVLVEARGLLGAPYEWGGMSERGIDCSGLVHLAFRRAGRLVPRDAHEQEEAGTKIEETELRAGDLITYGAEAADHIAFWLGGGRVLHSRGGVGVLEEPEPVDLHARRRRLVRL